MNCLFILNDIITGGYNVLFLDIFYFICILSGVYIIISKNPVVSVIFLICLFTVIALYLIFVNLKFIGISYILVYVGAVSILFVFILMLINIRISELLTETNNSLPLAIVTTLNFEFILSQVLPSDQAELSLSQKIYSLISNSDFTEENKEKQFLASSSNWDSTLVDNTDITSIGNVMYSSHSIWLVITSIILLLAMIGAIVITIKQR